MPDDLDAAQRREETERETGIVHVRVAAEEMLHAAGGDACLDCGGSIPAERKRAVPGAVRCVPCQTSYERLKHGV